MNKKAVTLVAIGMAAVAGIGIWTVASLAGASPEDERTSTFGYVKYETENGVQRVAKYSASDLKGDAPLTPGAVFADEENHVYKVVYYAPKEDADAYLKAINVDDGKTYVLGESGMEPESVDDCPVIDNDGAIADALGLSYHNRIFSYVGQSGTKYTFGADVQGDYLLIAPTAEGADAVGFDIQSWDNAATSLAQEPDMDYLSDAGIAAIQNGSAFAFRYLTGKIGSPADWKWKAVGQSEEYRIRVHTINLKKYTTLDVFELVIQQNDAGKLAIATAESLDTIQGDAEAQASRSGIAAAAVKGMEVLRPDIKLAGATAENCVTEILYANRKAVYAPVRQASSIAFPAASSYPLIAVSFRTPASGAPMLTIYMQPGHSADDFVCVGYSIASTDNARYLT